MSDIYNFMRFDINDESISHEPEAAFILQTIEQTPLDEDILVTLEDDHSYLEAEGTRADGFTLYYDYDDDQSQETLRTPQAIHDAATVAVVLERFAQGDSGWRTAVTWETPPKPLPPIGTDKLARPFGWAIGLAFGAMVARIALLLLELVNEEIASLAFVITKYAFILALLVVYLLYLRVFVREIYPTLPKRLNAATTDAGRERRGVLWLVCALALVGPLLAGFWLMTSIYGE